MIVEKELIGLVLLLIVMVCMLGIFLAIEGNKILYESTGCGVLPHGNLTNSDWYWDCK